MDVINTCLSLAPVPYLKTAFGAFKLIYDSVQEVQTSKQLLFTLAFFIAQLLLVLDREFRGQRLDHVRAMPEVQALQKLLHEIAAFIRRQNGQNFFKLLFSKRDRIIAIESYHKKVEATVAAFQLSAFINIQDWQRNVDIARVKDQKELNSRLSDIEANQAKLVDTLGSSQLQGSTVALNAWLQKVGQDGLQENERQFAQHVQHYLAAKPENDVEVQPWLITSFEVEFGRKIGSGGFGEVFSGTWNRTPVALKILKIQGGAPASVPSIKREIKAWSSLNHPHVLKFLGANILDDQPFIVMPFLKNGNARDYVQDHESCDRLQILHDIALGLAYLHSKNIIHGDLKAVNVLIDDAERAVLCDFGLSHIKADATASTARFGGNVGPVGSRNWMSPERLKGGGLKKPVDIYAFGMTIFELITGEIPLAHIEYHDFIELVVKGDTRPEYPEDEDLPALSPGLWKLAEMCWTTNSTQRPTAVGVCDTLSVLQHSPRAAPLPPPKPVPPVSEITPRRVSPQPPTPDNHAVTSRLLPLQPTPSPRPASETGQQTSQEEIVRMLAKAYASVKDSWDGTAWSEEPTWRYKVVFEVTGVGAQLQWDSSSKSRISEGPDANFYLAWMASTPDTEVLPSEAPKTCRVIIIDCIGYSHPHRRILTIDETTGVSLSQEIFYNTSFRGIRSVQDNNPGYIVVEGLTGKFSGVYLGSMHSRLWFQKKSHCDVFAALLAEGQKQCRDYENKSRIRPTLSPIRPRPKIVKDTQQKSPQSEIVKYLAKAHGSPKDSWDGKSWSQEASRYKVVFETTKVGVQLEWESRTWLKLAADDNHQLYLHWVASRPGIEQLPEEAPKNCRVIIIDVQSLSVPYLHVLTLDESTGVSLAQEVFYNTSFGGIRAVADENDGYLLVEGLTGRIGPVFLGGMHSRLWFETKGEVDRFCQILSEGQKKCNKK